jgi:hypothetical protein
LHIDIVLVTGENQKPFLMELEDYPRISIISMKIFWWNHPLVGHQNHSNYHRIDIGGIP